MIHWLEKKTYAKPTPATTGTSDNTFCRLHRLLNSTAENITVKNGVDARTT